MRYPFAPLITRENRRYNRPLSKVILTMKLLHMASIYYNRILKRMAFNKFKLNNTICSLCLTNKSTHAFNDCGHKCLCQICAETVDTKCVICRRYSAKIIRIYDC